MKLKWKIPLLFFLLSVLLFSFTVFYLRLEVIEGIFERVQSHRQDNLISEKEIAKKISGLYPDQIAMNQELKKASLKEKISINLFDKEAKEILYQVKTLKKGRGVDVQWYAVRHKEQVIAFLQISRPYTAEEVGLGQALTETLTFLLLLVGCAFVLLALYLNTSVTRPLTLLNQRLEQVGQGSPSTPLVSDHRSDEIGELYRKVGEMEARLQQAHREQVEMVAAITHDLKTPLTSLNGFLELLGSDAPRSREERHEYLRVAQRKAVTITQLLEDFSAFTRDEGILCEDNFRPCSMATLMDSIIEEYDAELTGLGYCFHWEYKISNQICVLLNEAMIRRVFANLIHNAVRYGNNTHLTVRMVGVRKGDQVHISVEDNGDGVEEVHLPQLFQPFYTADPSRASGAGGSGLGLASCHSIIRRHGGEIRAYTSSLGGLGISFSLPIYRED